MTSETRQHHAILGDRRVITLKDDEGAPRALECMECGAELADRDAFIAHKCKRRAAAKGE